MNLSGSLLKAVQELCIQKVAHIIFGIIKPAFFVDHTSKEVSATSRCPFCPYTLTLQHSLKKCKEDLSVSILSWLDEVNSLNKV